jgi:hypothetical protein
LSQRLSTKPLQINNKTSSESEPMVATFDYYKTQSAREGQRRSSKKQYKIASRIRQQQRPTNSQTAILQQHHQ